MTTGTLRCPRGEWADSATRVFIWAFSHLDITQAQPGTQAPPRRAVAGLGSSGLSLLDTAASSPRRVSSIAPLSQTDLDTPVSGETEEFRVLGSCKVLWAVFSFG